MKRLFCFPVFFLVALAATAAPAPSLTPYEGPAVSRPQNRIDELVFGRLETLGMQPTRLCTDSVFIRRLYLDVIGTLPTAPPLPMAFRNAARTVMLVGFQGMRQQ